MFSILEKNHPKRQIQLENQISFIPSVPKLICLMRQLCCLILIFGTVCQLSGQYDSYTWYREVEGVTQGGWHRIPIPGDMLPGLRDDMKDLRLMQLGEDTVETPYLLFSEGYSKSWEGVAIKELNERDGKFTFRYEGTVVPNRMKVEVDQRNFDLVFSLEGSNNRLIWDPVLSDVRILGVASADVSYVMNEVAFPQSDHKFYRLVWEDPLVQITGVSLGKVEEKEGVFQQVPVTDWEIVTDTDRKQSVVHLQLDYRRPVSKVVINLESDDGEFVRTVDFRYARQTIEETDGTKRYLWRDWEREVLSSYEPAEFQMEDVLTDYIEMTVFDQDELPLAIRSVEVYGLAYEMRAMCAGDLAYEVIYGSETARAPGASRTRPPSSIRTATLGPEKLIHPEDQKEEDGSPLGFMPSGSDSMAEWGRFAIGFFVALVLIFGIRFIRNRRSRS